MGLRVTSTVLVLLMSLALALPSAVAQSPPRIDVKIDWAIDHVHTLPETGRDNMKFTITVTLGNTTCLHQDSAKNARIGGNLGTEFFPKWAGASIVPNAPWYVEIPRGAPGPASVMQYPVKEEQTPVLNLAWNLDDRPRKDALHDYVIYTKDTKVVDGQCVQNPAAFEAKSRAMSVRMEDVVEENVTESCDPTVDPDKCLSGPTLSQQADGDAPLFDVTVLVAAVMGLAFVLRRRRSA